jgi:hypothetical protein
MPLVAGGSGAGFMYSVALVLARFLTEDGIKRLKGN